MGLAWRGDYQGAIQKFDAALVTKPGYANALYERGNAYFSLQDYPTALRDYEASVKAGRGDTNAGWNLGWTYYVLGRYQDAIRVDRAVLEQDSPEELFAALETFMISRTVMIISHRRVAIEQVDRVIELEHGRVIRHSS